MFCKYLHNESLDLYEILNLSSYVSNEVQQNFWWGFMHAHVPTMRKRVQIQRKNYPFSMNFAYFYCFVPAKSSKMDNFRMILEFFGNSISKWPNLTDKMTSLPCYRLLSSTSNKQILFNRTKWTHCICNNVCNIFKCFCLYIQAYPCTASTGQTFV